MKQLQFAYVHENSDDLLKQLLDLKNTPGISDGNIMFQVFSEILDPAVIDRVCKIIGSVFPGVPYMCCSTSGNIVDCRLASVISVVCTVFESQTTRFEIFQYDLRKKSVSEITAEITEETNRRPWVRAIEMYFTIPEVSSTPFCDGLNCIRPDIHIFGGVVCSPDITSDSSFVASEKCGYSEHSVIAVFYGGDDFYVKSMKITGWKPIKRIFRVTKASGCILYELDGIPAYDVYRNYLNINNDENFFYNTLEFPLFYEHNGETILRVPVASNPDGSITMSSDIETGSVVRISYGDPETILESIRADSKEIRQFQPDIMHIFSCAARRAFWTSSEPTYELHPFESISSSSGFFSHGEFIRSSGCLNQHNVTLVIASMREGRTSTALSDESSAAEEDVTSKLSLVSRLATFISSSSLDLERINARLEIVNRNLRTAAITDGLTGLFNRGETQAQIEKSLAHIKDEAFSLIMIDIDNFKQVNDTYGHQEGDSVIIALSDILRNGQPPYTKSFSAGRWGGEEFMLILYNTDLSLASHVAELIRQCFSNTAFPLAKSQTVSIGVTQARVEDTSDSLCTRVDEALYKAKKTGKNKVVAI